MITTVAANIDVMELPNIEWTVETMRKIQMHKINKDISVK